MSRSGCATVNQVVSAVILVISRKAPSPYFCRVQVLDFFCLPLHFCRPCKTHFGSNSIIYACLLVLPWQRGVGSFYKYIACMVINHHDQPKWGTEAPSGTEKELGSSRTDMGFGLCGGQPKWSTKMMNRATYGTEKDFRLIEVWLAWVKPNTTRKQSSIPHWKKKGSSRTDVGQWRTELHRALKIWVQARQGWIWGFKLPVACRQWFGVNRVPVTCHAEYITILSWCWCARSCNEISKIVSPR